MCRVRDRISRDIYYVINKRNVRKSLKFFPILFSDKHYFRDNKLRDQIICFPLIFAILVSTYIRDRNCGGLNIDNNKKRTCRWKEMDKHLEKFCDAL